MIAAYFTPKALFCPCFYHPCGPVSCFSRDQNTPWSHVKEGREMAAHSSYHDLLIREWMDHWKTESWETLLCISHIHVNCGCDCNARVSSQDGFTLRRTSAASGTCVCHLAGRDIRHTLTQTHKYMSLFNKHIKTVICTIISNKLLKLLQELIS